MQLNWKIFTQLRLYCFECVTVFLWAPFDAYLVLLSPKFDRHLMLFLSLLSVL